MTDDWWLMTGNNRVIYFIRTIYLKVENLDKQTQNRVQTGSFSVLVGRFGSENIPFSSFSCLWIADCRPDYCRLQGKKRELAKSNRYYYSCWQLLAHRDTVICHFTVFEMGASWTAKATKIRGKRLLLVESLLLGWPLLYCDRLIVHECPRITAHGNAR